ncbi:MAG TPA: 3-hydroxyacyl-CoA dehydrogenase NAD-binding domain-containing protein, partial [Holophagaceae bacterium]|nr:3-hydroxyacyl-CoA dehydrogenase NAD-binding domain-containing protein [Holophagaceae bacterium]
MDIKKVAVLGSGVMGSGIAAHVASAGCQVELLDIVIDEAAPDKLAEGALAGLAKSKPALMMHPSYLKKIRPGNLRDHLDRLADCDWVVEVVKEDLKVKQDLYARLESHLKPGAWISSNTSGIPLRLLVEGRSEAFRKHFVITHFFNPVRYLRLLEFVKGPEVDDAESLAFRAWLEEKLGKEVVPAFDSPTFIGNRIGIHGIMCALHLALAEKIPFEVIDSVMGDAAARAKSALFRTADLAGVDIMAATAKNVYDLCPNDEERDTFKFPPILDWMLQNKVLGNKTKGGFFKKDKGPDGKKLFLSLDPETKAYRPQEKKDWPILKELKGIDDPAERVKALFTSDSEAGRLAWRCAAPNLIYATNRLGEVTDLPLNVDNAVKNGFAFDLGPFELWDTLGLERVVARLRFEERQVPALVERMLAKGVTSFYRWQYGVPIAQLDPRTLEFVPILEDKQVLILKREVGRGKVIAENGSAQLIDLGDDVACLAFRSKMNALDDGIVMLMEDAVQKHIPGRFKGLVVGNQGKVFSAGANLVFVLNAAREKKFDLIEEASRRLQYAARALTYAPFPTVAAPFQLVLGGGCEVTLACQRAVGSAETYMGLVEVGVGVIPAGGGCLQMLLRLEEALNAKGEKGPMPKVRAAFQFIGTANVNTSFDEAQRNGYFRRTDRRVMNAAHLLAEAKAEVLKMAADFKPVAPRTMRLPGRGGSEALKMAVRDFQLQGLASEHDAIIMGELANVLCGGDVSLVQDITEERILELEREAFARLCGYEKTQARMDSILTKGKP